MSPRIIRQNTPEERAKVYAVFSPSGTKITPIAFEWLKEKRHVRAVTYTWKTRRGSALFLHFAVRDDTHAYELLLNTATLTWCVKEYTEEECAFAP